MRNWMVVCAAALVVFVAAGAAAGAMAADRSERTERWMTGTIVAVDVKAMTLTLRNEVSGGGVEEIAFIIDPTATVRVHGLRGKLDQLKAGDVITVKYTMRQAQAVILEIQHM